MPIIAAAFLPPSPLLIPEIGKQNYQVLQKTTQAYQLVADILKAEEVETIIIISTYSNLQNDNISFNISPQLAVNFQEFGYLTTNRTFSPALRLVNEIKTNLNPEYSVKLLSQGQLDYGCAVPLQLLNPGSKLPKILPIFPAEKQNSTYHYKFAQELSSILKDSSEKIAVIAVGDLSHRLKKTTVSTYSPKGARFDNRLIEYLNDQENGQNKILNIDESVAIEAQDNSLKQLGLIFGLIGENYETQVLAYQNDFGVGYLSVNFNLQVATI